MNRTNFPIHVCNILLPQDSSGYDNFFISIRTSDYVYIGERNNIISKLNQQNSGYGSTSTKPSYRRPFAAIGYCLGFSENKPLRQSIEKLWKLKRDFLIDQGSIDAKVWFNPDKYAICELDNDL